MTAVEFLISRIGVLIPDDIGSQLMFKSNVKKAIEMEKQQIIESFKHGELPPLFSNLSAEQYYNETYSNNSKQ